MFRKLTSILGWESVEAEKVSPPEDVRVQYEKSLYAVSFDKADSKGSPKGVTVGFLREKVGEIIGNNDIDSILLYQITPQQRRLVDNESYLVDKGIMTGDRILAIVSTDKHNSTSGGGGSGSGGSKKKKKKSSKKSATPGSAASASTPPPTPKTPQEKIREVLENTEKDLGPHIDAFIKSPPIEKDARNDLHHRLSELVLQKMFVLDDIDVSEDSELRQARKSAINILHGYHTRLDEAFMNSNK